MLLFGVKVTGATRRWLMQTAHPLTWRISGSGVIWRHWRSLLRAQKYNGSARMGVFQEFLSFEKKSGCSWMREHKYTQYIQHGPVNKDTEQKSLSQSNNNNYESDLEWNVMCCNYGNRKCTCIMLSAFKTQWCLENWAMKIVTHKAPWYHNVYFVFVLNPVTKKLRYSHFPNSMTASHDKKKSVTDSNCHRHHNFMKSTGYVSL